MTEEALQRSIMDWLAVILPAGWFAMHVPNKPRSAVQGAKEKAMGARKGWPDLQLVGPHATMHFLEVKAEGGRLSPEQRGIHDRLRALGFRVAVVRSLDDVTDTLNEWGVPHRALQAASGGVA